jgi:hypothetical protein
MGALVAFAAGSSIAAGHGWGWGSALDAGWAGLCLTYASNFTDVLTVRHCFRIYQ